MASLSRPSAQTGLFEDHEARRLAQELSGWGQPRTLASSRWMRRARLKVVGALCKLVEEGDWNPLELSIFTAIPRGGDFTAAQLKHANARRLMARFRTELYRSCGAGQADGFLVAFLHGEWEPNQGVYRLHVHGIAAGGMIAVIDRLRRRPNYVRRKHEPDPVKDRVLRTRKPIEYLPHALTYLLKSYWVERWIGVVDEDGTVKRERGGRRIKKPYHTQVLLWLDRWSLQDITLLMNVRAGKQGLVLTNNPEEN